MSIINATTTAGVAVTGDTTGNLTIQSAGTNVATFTTAGNLNLQVSNAGISFNNSSAVGAATLNDYETGTFTPVLSAASGTVTATYTSRYGFYTKIGNLVYISLRIIINTVSGGSGALQITGLPFTSISTSSIQQNLGGVFTTGLNWGTSATQVSPWVPSNTPQVQYRGLLNNASNVDVQIGGASSGTYLDAQGCYIATF